MITPTLAVYTIAVLLEVLSDIREFYYLVNHRDLRTFIRKCYLNRGGYLILNVINKFTIIGLFLYLGGIGLLEERGLFFGAILGAIAFVYVNTAWNGIKALLNPRWVKDQYRTAVRMEKDDNPISGIKILEAMAFLEICTRWCGLIIIYQLLF